MTSKEFIMWLKGFTEGVHEYNVTPKQWDILKEKLAEVNDEPVRTSAYSSLVFSSGSSGTLSYPFPNTSITYTTGTETKTLLND